MMHLPGSKRVFIQQQIAAHDCGMSTISNLVQAPIRVKGPTVMVQPKAACSLQLAQKATQSRAQHGGERASVRLPPGRCQEGGEG